MPDFSDKYKKALEYQDISPDFKERTARLMTELRDGSEPARKTADEELLAASFTVTDSRIKTSRRINRIKLLSTAAAAAACLMVGVALSNAGVFDRDELPTAVDSDGAVTEATDVIESLEETVAAEARSSVSEVETEPEILEYIAEETDGILIHGVTEEAAETEVTVGTEATETEAGINEPAPAPAAGAVPAMLPEIPDDNESAQDIPVEAAPTAETAAEEAETVLMLAPFTEDVSEEILDGGLGDTEESEVEEEFEEDEAVEAVEDDGSSDMSRASDFSPRRAVAGFPAQSSSALITPSFEDSISDDGTVVKFEPRRIRSVTRLLELNKEMYVYAEEDSPSVGSKAPSDSRYIIDYTGEQGTAMRIYVGSRYICFAYNDSYYTYELTEEEYKEMDSLLFGLVS